MESDDGKRTDPKHRKSNDKKPKPSKSAPHPKKEESTSRSARVRANNSCFLLYIHLFSIFILTSINDLDRFNFSQQDNFVLNEHGCKFITSQTSRMIQSLEQFTSNLTVIQMKIHGKCAKSSSGNREKRSLMDSESADRKQEPLLQAGMEETTETKFAATAKEENL
ncbi:unnamed protein product [Caenorhabditis brenneri]